MKMYLLSESEIDSLVSLGSSIDLTFFGIACGAFISLGITLFTVQITEPKKYAAFVGTTVLAGFLTVFFAARAISSYRRAQKRLEAIKHPQSE
jgi:hypothetical protein